MNKRFYLIIALLLGIGTVQAQKTDPVTYIERSWNGTEVVSEEKTKYSYDELSGTESTNHSLWGGGWYVVKSSFQCKRVIVEGYVNLILCDGATLTAPITINNTSTLVVYGQSNGTGRLVASAYKYNGESTNEYYCTASIGSDGKGDMGELVIHGGNITADASNVNNMSAGIGGGGAHIDFLKGSCNGGTVTVYGGTVNATGGEGAAGIGAGSIYDFQGNQRYNGGNGGTLKVYGGTVTATGGFSSAGIGGAYDVGKNNGHGGTVKIYGGTVTATGGNNGAGIGGAYYGNGGTVEIYGGNVTATSPFFAAGIGGGCDANGGSVTINGGTVHANGGKDSAGIGCGERRNGTKHGGSLTVNDGLVVARGGSHGAGIGGGQDASGATVIINGGEVRATGGTDAAGIGCGEETAFNPNINGGSLTVNGGTVFADGTGWGAGIGGGEDADGATVIINGGSVTAWAGTDAGNKNGCAIGSEDGDGHRGTIYIGDTLMVHAGQNPTDADGHLFPKETRGAACFFRPYARIEPCNHKDASYSVSGTESGDTHTLHCGHCKTNATHEHTFNDQNVCTVCGVNATTYTVKVYLPVINGDGSYTNGNYGAPITTIMVSGTQIVLPAAPLSNEPRGMKFAGWLNVESSVNPNNLGTFITNSQEYLTLNGVDYTINEDTYLIARYHKVSLFNTSGDWNNSNNWYWHQVPGANDTIVIAAEAIIPAGCTAQGGDRIELDLTGTITIKDGGQLINDVGVWGTVEKTIEGHNGSAESGWHFIAQPTMNFVTPSLSNGFLTEDSTKYDLYYFHEPTHHWRNYKQGANNEDPHFYIEPDKGYLYANETGTTLVMSGTIRPSTTPFTIRNLSHKASSHTGWNLVGNPFACNATVSRPCFTIQTENGKQVIKAAIDNLIIGPCESVMVKADAVNDSVTFTMTTASLSSQPGNGSLQITLAQANQTRGASTGSATFVDNAIVSFKEGEQLGKFYFGSQNANIYIPQGGEEYAIAFSDMQGEMPLNFKALENGTYTISVNSEGVEMNYLHLIDNLTGADVDLLAHAVSEVPELVEGVEGHAGDGASTGSATSYTFTAKTTDYASRFRLVFSANDENGASTDSAAFAFVSDGNIIVPNASSEATLQIVDMTGRVVLRSDVMNRVLTSGIPAGVYMLRLIDGNDVKTQKIIIQ